MQFFATIDDKTVQVQVARPPKNPDLLSNFKKTNGSTYTGASELFIGLKKGNKPGFYIAVSVKTAPIPIVQVKEECSTFNQSIVNDTEDSTEEVNESNELKITNVVALAVTGSIQECCEYDIDFRKFDFDFDFARVNPENRNAAWLTYINDKNVWITQYGSEQLKLAHEMGCRCDNKYIVERVLRDFPAFHIYEEYPLKEMDTPDISFLLFLRNEAFNTKQKQTFKKFNSRICLGWNFDDTSNDPAETEVIIQGFLGMCDLMCVFKDLFLHVEQSNKSLPDLSYRIGG